MVRLKKSRKANSFYLLIFSLVFIAILFYIVFGLLAKYEEISKHKKIGERQNELVRVYQRAENFLLYNDLAASLAVQQGVHDFAKNGGMKTRACGSYKGQAVWDFGNDCFARQQDLAPHIIASLDDHAEKYPDKKVKIPKNNYAVLISSENQKLTVIGIGQEPIIIEVGK